MEELKQAGEIHMTDDIADPRSNNQQKDGDVQENNEDLSSNEEGEDEFKSICDFVPNDFAINTIVRLHKINAVVTQYHTPQLDFGPITPTQQELLLQVSPPISAN